MRSSKALELNTNDLVVFESSGLTKMERTALSFWENGADMELSERHAPTASGSLSFKLRPRRKSMNGRREVFS